MSTIKALDGPPSILRQGIPRCSTGKTSIHPTILATYLKQHLLVKDPSRIEAVSNNIIDIVITVLQNPTLTMSHFNHAFAFCNFVDE